MNQQVQDYFYNLYHFSKNLKRHLPLNIYLNMGKKGKMFDDDFYDKSAYEKSKKYHRYLNF